MELADNVRDLLTSLLEVRVAQAANRLNEVMKSITAWAGIVLVPTLIAGIYGMNFRPHARARVAARLPDGARVMAARRSGSTSYFKRRGWL